MTTTSIGPVDEAPDAAWIDDLLSKKEFVRHEALRRLAGGEVETFLHEATAREPAARAALFAALWKRADVLLLEGRGRVRRIFEVAGTSLLEDEGLRQKWRMLFALLRKAAPPPGETGERPAASYPDPEKVRRTLTAVAEGDRRVFARCLLFHPWEPYRLLAPEFLEPTDFWEVIAHDSILAPRLLELWRHLRPRVPDDYLKIFFVCVHERLLSSAGDATRPAAVELAKELFLVDSFHQATFFQLLTRLDEELGEAVGADAEYVRRWRQFGEGQPTRDLPIHGWRNVPLGVQRRLAHRGHFLLRFACHPADPIAMECLPYLEKRDDVTDFLKLTNINAQLLNELATMTRLFHNDRQKLLLVANPKTPTHVVAKHIGFLRGDSLRALAQAPECNPYARDRARKLVAQRDKFRTGTPRRPHRR